jgi:hypothetical protein
MRRIFKECLKRSISVHRYCRKNEMKELSLSEEMHSIIMKVIYKF